MGSPSQIRIREATVHDREAVRTLVLEASISIPLLFGICPFHLKARGLGIATELIKESGRRALALGATTLHLHTSDMMESAVKLYERLGFERASDKDIYNGETLVKSYRIHLPEAALL